MVRLYIFNNPSRAANYGMGTYIDQLIFGLAKRGQCAITLVEFCYNLKEVTLENDSNDVLHFKIPAMGEPLDSESYWRRVFYIMARHIGYSCNNIIFQFNYFNQIHLALLLKSQYPDSRIILTVHYLFWRFELNGNQARFEKIVKGNIDNESSYQCILDNFHLEQSFLRLADEVIVLSQKTKELIKNTYNIADDKLWLIYNGLKDIDLQKFGGSTQKQNILYVGRLDDNKGLGYLIKAFEIISQMFEEATLVVAGDGDFQKYLSGSRSLKGRVSFLGRISRDDLEEVYSNAYIGVIPSFNEQCSYTVIEMMRRGIPIIGTNSTGLSEMFSDFPELRVHIDETNFREEEFITQLVEKVKCLFLDKNYYHQKSHIVRESFLKKYELSKMIETFTNVISYSLVRDNYIVSMDFLQEIDAKMKSIIDKNPDIDTCFYGASGIGAYLWYRILSIRNNIQEKEQCLSLQEYLVYYLDWLYDLAKMSALPKEIYQFLHEMFDCKFYQTKIVDILSLQPCDERGLLHMVKNSDIIKNALRIYGTKL